eukprot:369481-Hanusia_phi.AAC.1
MAWMMRCDDDARKMRGRDGAGRKEGGGKERRREKGDERRREGGREMRDAYSMRQIDTPID